MGSSKLSKLPSGHSPYTRAPTRKEGTRPSTPDTINPQGMELHMESHQHTASHDQKLRNTPIESRWHKSRSAKTTLLVGPTEQYTLKGQHTWRPHSITRRIARATPSKNETEQSRPPTALQSQRRHRRPSRSPIYAILALHDVDHRNHSNT